MSSINNNKDNIDDINMIVNTTADIDEWEITSNDNDNLDIISLTQDANISLPPAPPTKLSQGTNSKLILVDSEWMKIVFPTKDDTKIESWLTSLHSQEFDTVKSLLDLNADGWDKLGLPLGVTSQLQSYLAANPQTYFEDIVDSRFSSTELSSASNFPKPISQVDCVVIDVSASMRAKSTIDCDKTREDVSKMLFHTLIDKLIMLELSHAVGLLAFGDSLMPIAITNEYEKFHDELGRLDAVQCGTMLYDAIYDAAKIIDSYCAAANASGHPQHTLASEEVLKKRIFVLTDGEDNMSSRQPWEVAKFLQQKNIQLDAIPLAGPTKILQSICTASGGIFFEVQSQEQGINLFEREATLHLSFREANASVPPLIESAEILKALESSSAAPVLEIKSVVPQSVFAPVLSVADVVQKQASNVTMPGSMRRVIKEYMQLMKDPVPGFEVYMGADDSTSWKVLLTDLPTPYAGGSWVLTLNFPNNFPFQSPKVKFITPIYHCNVSVDGNICMDTLRDSWNPAITIAALLSSLRRLLLEPNGNDALDAYKGALYRDYITEGKAAYFQEASAHTTQHAGESAESLRSKYHLE